MVSSGVPECRLFAPIIAVASVCCYVQAFAAGPSQEAIDALQGLRSVTQAGVSYPEYATRFLDAKVKVDHYLSSTGATLDSQDEIKTAILSYELVYQGWGSELSLPVPVADKGTRFVVDDTHADAVFQRAAIVINILSGMVALIPRCTEVGSFSQTILPPPTGKNGKSPSRWKLLPYYAQLNDKVLPRYKSLEWACASSQVDLVLKNAKLKSQ